MLVRNFDRIGDPKKVKTQHFDINKTNSKKLQVNKNLIIKIKIIFQNLKKKSMSILT